MRAANGRPTLYICTRMCLGIWMFNFPFQIFNYEMLGLMNVSHVQLHPNNWAFLRAFQILCKSLNIEPIVNKFMYFYELKMGAKVGWASLNAYTFRKLFRLYSHSWEKFQVKVFPSLSQHRLWTFEGVIFKEDEKTPKFPFYWKRYPFKFKSHLHQILSA